ncbi:hypothetical protein [Desulfurococcus amylolyticus]|nr:hypothetical protein [Desulfurococcus amylolyticus]
MPLAKSWVEELAQEYYILRGFIAYADVPIGSGKRGVERMLMSSL